MTPLKQVHLLLILSFLVTFFKKILEKKGIPTRMGMWYRYTHF